MYETRNSNLFGEITIFFIICCCYLPTEAKYGGGSGTPEDPYLIYDASQMNAIGADANDWDKCFKLMADIDLSAYTGASFNIIGINWVNPFTGVFDGNDHTISNFTYTSTGRYNIALFGYVGGENAEIKDLGLTAPDVNAGTGLYVGSLVGRLNNGILTNCYVEGGNVSGNRYIGELVGYSNGTITDCYSNGGVSGYASIGGLVGANYGIITYCSSTGSVLGSYSVGGLVGYNSNGIITYCSSTGSVSGNDRVGGLVGDSSGTITNCYSIGGVSGFYNVGGLVGDNNGIITNCYSTGGVSGYAPVGGLIGINGGNGIIKNCYSTGSVVGDGAGGLVEKNDGTVLSSFWDIETSGRTTSSGGRGLTTAEMQMASTFVCWDYEPVWTIDEGVDYPRLVWENKPGELITVLSDLYGGGTGEPEDPYLIYTAQQLNTIGFYSCHFDKHFKLMADVDLSGFTGKSFNCIGIDYSNPFSGVFDGNGHTILNFTYTSPGTSYTGLFRYVDDTNAEIKNLGLINANINAGTGRYVGSLVGYMGEGTITNCYVEGGSVSGNKLVGGLVGFNSDGTITDCYATGGVSGNSLVGGLVGDSNGTITNCYSSGSVSGEGAAGGLAGSNRGTISNSYSIGSVSGDNVGGLVGSNSGTITNCYSTGGVSGDQVGGLVGYSSGTITYCSSTGSVVGRYNVGGLVGYNSIGTISNCYSTGGVSGYEYVGGLVGYNSSGIITYCSSSSIVTGPGYFIGGLVGYIGGLVGYSGGTIANCYSTGGVSGYTRVGGLVGGTIDGTITNSYSTCSVSGDSRVGGLVGENNGTINNCYSIGSVSGNDDVGGLVGIADHDHVSNSFWDIETSGQTTSASGTGKTTAEMQTLITFMAWMCDSAWTIDEGNDYPRLLWENMPGVPINPKSFLGSGSGTQADPYLIHTAEKLNTIGLFPCILDRHFKLMADIDLGGYTGEQFNIIGNSTTKFSGVFDGNGHTVTNFNHTSTGSYNIGLFGYVYNGDIKNLGLIEPNIDAGTKDYIGSLVGLLREGAITGCYVEGGSVAGGYEVGGLVGIIYKGKITNCYSTASVSGTGGDVGGLVGENGWDGTITNCYATGSVVGESAVGGLVGENGWYGTITNCYATGSVTGHLYVGGLAGYSSSSGHVVTSYWDIETSGQTTSAGGTGLTTTEMRTMSTFTDAGWDFVGETVNGIEDIWFIPKGDYPHLWWEGMKVPMKLTPGTLNCRSKGVWVKARLTLPEGFTVADVDSGRPAVLHSFGFQSEPLYVFVNKDKVVEIEAAFERQAVCSLADNWPQELTVAGFLSDGNIFLGTSTVGIIHPDMKVIDELAWYWLNADCVQPDFCDGIDMNRDSIVNLLDYSLLMNTEVEFFADE